MQEEHTLKDLMQRLGVQNYQQLALLDKRYLIEAQSSERLYQQKDELYHQISIKKSLQITQNTESPQPPPYKFTQFTHLTEYLKPSTWSLEIIGPSLCGKSLILRDLAKTMSQEGNRVLYVSILDYYQHQNEQYKVVYVKQSNELFLLLCIILEKGEKEYDLIIIDGLSSLLYQMGSLAVVETEIEELHLLIAKLIDLEIQIVISSISKSKDLIVQDCNIIFQQEFIKQDKLFQKPILNPPWNMIWQSQLSIQRSQETRLDQSKNKDIYRYQYFNFYNGIMSNHLII